MKHYEIKWMNKSKGHEKYISHHFGWVDVHQTLNGHSDVNVKEEHLSDFMATIKAGYIVIIQDKDKKA